LRYFGIVDVEAWLATLEPRVIDAWLAFASVEPEAFGSASKIAPKGGAGRTKWASGADAVNMLAARFGG
jgi:cytolysin (calcineurin-like family phosphatase)